jgi:hypothetical protein
MLDTICDWYAYQRISGRLGLVLKGSMCLILHELRQAESPDEEALVSAARELQWEFVDRSPTEVFVISHGQRLTYR